MKFLKINYLRYLSVNISGPEPGPGSSAGQSAIPMLHPQPGHTQEATMSPSVSGATNRRFPLSLSKQFKNQSLKNCVFRAHKNKSHPVLCSATVLDSDSYLHYHFSRAGKLFHKLPKHAFYEMYVMHSLMLSACFSSAPGKGNAFRKIVLCEPFPHPQGSVSSKHLKGLKL